MYSTELEVRLNNEIEQPFNTILDGIDSGGMIGREHNETIARYVVAMLRRVPAGRTRSKDALPSVIARVEQQHLDQIDALERLVPSEHDAARGRTNIAEIFARVRNQTHDWLWHETLLPERLPRLTALLAAMTWEQWTTPNERQLFIGDDPVLFDDSQGLAHEKAELILPIRKDTVLVANWRTSIAGGRRKLSVQKVRFINSRVVNRAQRWIFFAHNEKWIIPFFRKQPGGRR